RLAGPVRGGLPGELHGSQDLLWRRRRACLPGLFAPGRERRGRAPRQGPARQALLPARPPRQVGADLREHRRARPQVERGGAPGSDCRARAPRSREGRRRRAAGGREGRTGSRGSEGHRGQGGRGRGGRVGREARRPQHPPSDRPFAGHDPPSGGQLLSAVLGDLARRLGRLRAMRPRLDCCRYADGGVAMKLRTLLFSLAGLLVPAFATAQTIPDLGGRTIVIVTENAYFPLQFVDPKSGQPAGWEYDAIDAMAKKLNFKPEYEHASWDVMIQAVSDKQYDMGMTGITITEERKQKVDFSDPYMKSEILMLVRGDETRFNDAESFEADEDLLIGAQAGTSPFYVAVYEVLDGNEDNPRIKLMETFAAT